jgi:hypothetical protein
MKINEFGSKQQVEEGIFGDIGNAVKGAFADPSTKLSNRTQKLFINDFISNASNALNSGLRSGLIVPKAATPTPDAAPNAAEVDPAAVEPAAGEPGAVPTSPTDVRTPLSQQQQRQAQQQTTQNINNYIKGAATAIKNATDKNQKIALTKELINAMADRKGTPEWDNALGTVKQIIKTGGLDPSFAGGALSNLAAGKLMTEAWKIYFINKLVEAVGLTWKELGLSVLKENKKYYIAETKYVKLNKLFESIVEADAPAPDSAGGSAKSVTDYMSRWFKNFMKGVNYADEATHVSQLINALEAAVIQDGNKVGRATQTALGNLATTAYSIQSSGGSDAAASTAEAPQPAANASPLNATGVQAQINALKLSDPKGYAAIVKQIISDYKKTFAGKSTATAESRRRRYPKL